MMHDGMPYGRIQGQGQGQGHSREVDRQSPTGLIFYYTRCLKKVDHFYFMITLASLDHFLYFSLSNLEVNSGRL